MSPDEVRRLQAEHAAAVTALHAAIRDTTRLTRLLTILSEPGPLNILLDRVLLTLSELFSSDVVALLQRSEGETFTPLAAIGLPEERAHRSMSGAEGSPIAAALRARGPVLTEDVLLDPRVNAELGDLGVRTVVWLPVIDDGVAAVMLLARCRLLPFASADLDLLAAMAYRIAVALERARAESRLREAQERLLQTEKLALAGKLAGSIAHELNNPLSCVRSNLTQLGHYLPAVAATFRIARDATRYLEAQPEEDAHGYARLLRAATGDQEDFAADLEEILSDSMDGARRIGHLVSSFMRLSSADRPVEAERQDVREIIAECVADLPPDTGRPPLVHEVDDGPPCVAWIAPSVLKAGLTGLLRILLSPGLQRTGPARTVVIRTEQTQGRPVVVVSDPALVLSEDEQRAIFDPRLEEVDTPGGRTVRLNLVASLSYQLLRGCGAEVSTIADGEHGLTIRILLPVPPETDSTA